MLTCLLCRLTFHLTKVGCDLEQLGVDTRMCSDSSASDLAYDLDEEIHPIQNLLSGIKVGIEVAHKTPLMWIFVLGVCH